MKTPIEPNDIRIGDLIREERYGELQKSDPATVAVEYIAAPGLRTMNRFTGKRVYYLLDRPKPAVELPTVPTLGWVSGPESSPLFDLWTRQDVINEGPRPGAYATGQLTDSFVGAREITAFTPATAVPQAALDELRDNLTRCAPYGDDASNWMHLGKLCKDFLAAVDAANGPRA